MRTLAVRGSDHTRHGFVYSGAARRRPAIPYLSAGLREILSLALGLGPRSSSSVPACTETAGVGLSRKVDCLWSCVYALVGLLLWAANCLDAAGVSRPSLDDPPPHRAYARRVTSQMQRMVGVLRSRAGSWELRWLCSGWYVPRETMPLLLNVASEYRSCRAFVYRWPGCSTWNVKPSGRSCLAVGHRGAEQWRQSQPGLREYFPLHRR